MKKRIIKLLLSVALVTIIIMLVLLFYFKTDISWRCPFNFITSLIFKNGGLYCPGCGATRAVREMLKLNIADSLKYNLMFPLEALYILWVISISSVSYIKGGKFNYRSPCRAVDITVLIIVIIWFILRNIFNI